MSVLEAILLGAIQGLFMFVPVSSTSHLALTQHWLITRGSSLPPPDTPELILFDLVVHLGTMVSVGVVFRRSLGRLIRGTWEDLHARASYGRERRGRYVRLVGMGLLATATTGLVGIGVLSLGLDAVFSAPLVIAGLLAVTGVILWWTDRVGPRWRGLDGLTWAVAVAIGAVQGLALLPGLSRSGLTIAVALALGLRRRWAAEFSFFIAIPTIAGGSLLQAMLVARDGQPMLVDPTAFGLGFAVAAVVGVAALLMVLHLLYRARFRYFSFYVWGLALVVAFGLVTPV